MFQHFGVLKLKENCDPAARQKIVTGLLNLRDDIPGLTEVKVYEDLGIKDENADLIFILSFVDKESWINYGDSEAHKDLIKNSIAPVLDSKMFLQTSTEIISEKS